jgi:hypothetical protein
VIAYRNDSPYAVYQWVDRNHVDYICPSLGDVEIHSPEEMAHISARELIKVFREFNPEYANALYNDVTHETIASARTQLYQSHAAKFFDMLLDISFLPPKKYLTECQRRYQMADEEQKPAKNKNKKATPFPDNAKIRMGVDKDGKKYGPKNNPKRAGSASAERFELYKDGMTYKTFREKGGLLEDLRWDSAENRKFVIIEQP